MHAPLFSPLSAAVLTALLAATAPAQHVQLSTPLALEEAASSPAGDSDSQSPDGLVQDDAPGAGDLQQSKSPLTDGAVVADPNESKSLGMPQKLLGSARSAASEDADVEADREETGGIFGSVRGEALQALSALAVVLGLVFTLRAVLLRGANRIGGGGRPSGVLEILARYPVARGQHLILLKMARRILLVHHSGPTMTMLSEIADPDEVASLLARIEAGSTSTREASRFRSLFNQFTREHESAAARSDATGVKDAWQDGEVVDLTKRPRRGGGGLRSHMEGRAS